MNGRRYGRATVASALRCGLPVAVLGSGLALAGGPRQYSPQIILKAGDTFAGEVVSNIRVEDFCIDLNDAGDFAFFGGEEGSRTLYRGRLNDPAMESVVARDGAPYAGVTLMSLMSNSVVLNASGTLHFVATASEFPQFTRGLFNGNGALLVAPNSSVGGQAIWNVEANETGLTNDGRYAFLGDFPPEGIQSGIFFAGQMIAAEGQTIAGQFIDLLEQDVRALANDQGHVMYLANRDFNAQNSYALLRRNPDGSTNVVAQSGDSHPGLGTVTRLISWGYDLNAAGDAAYYAQFDSGARAVMVNSTPRLRDGDVLPDGGVIQQVQGSRVLFAPSGRVVCMAALNDGSGSGPETLVSDNGVVLWPGDAVGAYQFPAGGISNEPYVTDSQDRILVAVELDDAGNPLPALLLMTPMSQARGDMTCDGFVTVGDIGGFVLALTDPAGYLSQFPNCDMQRADMNADGVVSVGDIAGLVARLTGG